jgi:hypothetical protein
MREKRQRNRGRGCPCGRVSQYEGERPAIVEDAAPAATADGREEEKRTSRRHVDYIVPSRTGTRRAHSFSYGLFTPFLAAATLWAEAGL